MYYHYICQCTGKCPLYRGVLYSECRLSDLYMHAVVLQNVNNFCLAGILGV